MLALPKSESKSKSSRNGLKSGLESKFGLEYYKSSGFVRSCSPFSIVTGSGPFLLHGVECSLSAPTDEEEEDDDGIASLL